MMKEHHMTDKYTLGGVGFPTKEAIKKYWTSRKEGAHASGDVNVDPVREFLLDLLYWEPEHYLVIGVHRDDVQLRTAINHEGHWKPHVAVQVLVPDRDWEFISVRRQVEALGRDREEVEQGKVRPTFMLAMREAVNYQVRERRELAEQEGELYCESCGVETRLEVHHSDLEFNEIVDSFLDEYGEFEVPSMIELDGNVPSFEDSVMKETWRAWHEAHFQWQILCEECHRAV